MESEARQALSRLVALVEKLTERETPPSRWSRLVALVEKLSPTIIASAAGIAFLLQYMTFTGKQNAISLEISKNQVERAQIEKEVLIQQATSGRFEVTRKAAFQVLNEEHLSVEPLVAKGYKGKNQHYEVHWEVKSVNQGGRKIEIWAHKAEIFLGREQSKARESGAVLEINHPESDEGSPPGGARGDDQITGDCPPPPGENPAQAEGWRVSPAANEFIKWTPGLQRDFKPKRFRNRTSIGPTSPGMYALAHSLPSLSPSLGCGCSYDHASSCVTVLQGRKTNMLTGAISLSLAAR